MYRELIRDAKGFVIDPKALKAGFLLGRSGGSGVLVAEDQASGALRGPAWRKRLLVTAAAPG